MAATWLSKTLVPSGVVDRVVCGSFVENGHPGQAQVVLLHAGSSLEMLAIGASGAASSICSQPLQAGEAVLDLRVLRGGPTNGDGQPDPDSLILLVDGGRVTVLRFNESCNRFVLVQEVQLVGPGTQPRFMPRLLAPSPSGQHGVALAAFQDRILYLPPAAVVACAPAPAVTVAAGESATSVPTGDAGGVPREQVQASIPGAGTGDAAATAVPGARYRAVLTNTPVSYIHRLPLDDAVPPPVLTAGPIVGAAPRDLRRATADTLMASGSRLAASSGYLPLQLEPGCGAIWDLAIIESPCLSTDHDGAVAADGGLEGRGALKSGGKGFDGGWAGSAGPGHRQERQIAIGSGSGSAGKCGFRVVALVHRSSTDAGEVLLLRWIPGAHDLLLCDLVVRLGACGPSAGLSRTGACGPGQGQWEFQRPPLLGMAHVLRTTPPEHEAGLVVLGTHGAVFLLAALLVRHALPTSGRSDLRTVGPVAGSAPALEAASPLRPISAGAATDGAAGATVGGNSSLSGMVTAHLSADGCAGADGASAAATGAAAQPPVLSLECLVAAAFALRNTYQEAGTREGSRHSDGSSSSSGNGEGEEDDGNNDIGGPSAVTGRCRRLRGLATHLKFCVGRSQPPPTHHLQYAPEAASGRGWSYLRFVETQFAAATGTVAVAHHHVAEGDGDDGMEVSDGTGSGGSHAVRQAGSASAVTRSGARRSGASAVSGGDGDSSGRSGLCRYVGEEDDVGPGSRATSAFLRRCGPQRATGRPVHDRLREQFDRMASMIKLYRSVAEHAVVGAATAGDGGGASIGVASHAEWAAWAEHFQRFPVQPASKPDMLSLLQLQIQVNWMLRHLRREELEAQVRGVGDSTAMMDLRRAAEAAAKATAAAAAAAAAIEDVTLEECQGNAARPLPPLKQASPVIGVERLPVAEPHYDGHILSAAEWLPPMLSPATGPFGCNSIAGAPPKGMPAQAYQPNSSLANATSAAVAAAALTHGSVASVGPRLLVCAAAGPALCITLTAAGAPPPGASRAAAAAAAVADDIETTAGVQAAVSDRSFHDIEGAGGEAAPGLKLLAAAQEGAEGDLPVVHLKAIRCLMPGDVGAGASTAAASAASPAASGQRMAVRPARAVAALPSWSGGILVWSEEGGDVLILRHRYKPSPQLPQQHGRRQLQRLGLRLRPRPVAPPTQPSPAPPSPTPPALSPHVISAFAAHGAAGFPMDVGTCAPMMATAVPWPFARSSGSNLLGDGAIAGPSAAGGSQPPPRRRQGPGILGLTPGAGAWCQDAVGSASGAARGSGPLGPAHRTGVSAELRCDGPRRRGRTAPGSGGTSLGQPRTPLSTVRKAPAALALRLLGRAPQPRPMVDFVVTEAAGISGHGRLLQVTGAVLGLQHPEGAAPEPRDPKLQVLRGCLTAQVVARMPSQGATPTGLWSIPLRTPIAPAGVAPGAPSHAGGVAAPVPNPQPGAPPAGGSLIVLSFVGGSRALAPVLDTDFAAESGSGGSEFGPGRAPSPPELGVMEPSLRDVTDALQLRHWEPTVAAGLVAEGVFVQITQSGILMASLDLVSCPASGAAATVAVAPSGGSATLDDGDGPGVGVGSCDAPLPRSSWPSPKSSRYEDRSPLEQMPQLSQPLEAMYTASTRLQRQQQQHHREQQLWHGDGSQMPGTAAAAAERPPPGMAATSGGGGGESRGPSISGYSSMAEGMGAMALASDMQADDNAQGAMGFSTESLSNRQDGTPGAMSSLAQTQDGHAAPVFYGPFTPQCLQSMPPPPPPPALGPHALGARVSGSFQVRGDAVVDAHDGDGASTSAVEAEVSHGGVAWWNATASDITTGAVAPGCVVLVRRLDRRLTVLGVVQQTTSGGTDGSGTSRLSRKRPRSTLVLRELGFSLPLDCEPSCCTLRPILPSRSPSPQPRPHSAFRRSPSSSFMAAAIASAAATVPAAATTITDAVDSGAPGISVGAGTATALSAGLPPLPPRPGLSNQGGSPVLAVAGGAHWNGPASVSVGGASGGAPAAAAAAGTVHASSWRYQLLVGDHAPSIQLLLLTYGSSGLCCTRLARVSTTVPPGLGPCGGLTGPQSASVPESVLFIAPAPVPTAAAAALGPGGSSGGSRSSSSISSISTDRRELRTVMPSGLPGTHCSESAATAPAAYSGSPPDSSLMCLVGLRSGGVTVFSYGVAGVSAPAADHQVPSDDMEDIGFMAAPSGAMGANSTGGNGDGTEAMGSYALEPSKGSSAPEATTAAAEFARRSRRNGGRVGESGFGAELPGVLRVVWRCNLEQVPLRLASLAPCRPWQVLAVGSAVHLLELTAPSGRLLCSPLLPSTGNWMGTGFAATPHQPLPPPSKGLEALLAAPLYLPAAGTRDVSGAGVTAAIAGESRKQRPVAPSQAGSLPLELALVVLNDGSWRLLSLQRLSRLGRQPPSAMPLGPDSGGTISGMAGACPASLPIPGTVPIGRPRLLMHVPQLFPHLQFPGHAHRPSVQTAARLAPRLDGISAASGSEAVAAKSDSGATASHVTSPGGEGYLVLLADDAEGSQVQRGGSRYVHVLEAASGRQVTSFDVDAAASGFLATCACMWQVRQEADDDGGEAVFLGCGPGPRWQHHWWEQTGIRENQSALEVAEVAIAAPPPAAAGVELHNEHVGPGAAAAAPVDEDLERGLQMVREMVGEVDAVMIEGRQHAPPRWRWRHRPRGRAEAAEPNDARGPRAIDEQLEADADGDGDAEGPMDDDVEVVARRLWHLVEAEMVGQALPTTRMGDSRGAAATGRRCRPPTGAPHMLLVIGCTGQGGGEVMVLHMVPALLQLVAQPHGSGAGDGVSGTAAAKAVSSPNANTPIEHLGEDWFPWPLARSRSPLQRWLGWSGWAYPGGEAEAVAVEPAPPPSAADGGDGADARIGSATTASTPTTAAEYKLPTTRVVHLQVVHRLLLAKPVTALCPYNEETLMVAAGRRMLIYTMRDGRLHRTGWVATRNPITVMSACSARSLLACTDGVTGVMLYTALSLRTDSVPGAQAAPPFGLRLIAADAIHRPITSLLLMPSQSLPSRQLPQSLPSDQSGPSMSRTGAGASHASPPGEAMDAGPVANERNAAGEASGQTPAGEAAGMNAGESSAIIAATDSLGRLLLLTPGPATLLSCRNLITLAAVQCPDAGLRLRAHLPNPVTRYNMARPLQPKVPGLLLAGLSGAVHHVRPCPDAAVPLLFLLERALASHWAARLPTGGRHRSAQEAEVDALDEAGRWWWWCHQGHPGVLDGDLLEQLLDLPRPAKLQVLRRVPAKALRAALAASGSGRDAEYYEAVAAVDTKLQALAQAQEQEQVQESCNGTAMQVDGCAAGPLQAVAHEEEALGDRLREASSRKQPQQLHGGTSAEAGSGMGASDDDDLDSVLQVLQDILTL